MNKDEEKTCEAFMALLASRVKAAYQCERVEVEADGMLYVDGPTRGYLSQHELGLFVREIFREHYLSLLVD